MFVNILFLVIISSGSIFGVAIYNKRYEEILPITCSVIVMLLFLSGIFGHLKIGIMLISTVAIALYIFSFVWIIYKKNLYKFLSNLLTSGLFIFILFIALFYYLDKGKLVAAWDEFSHWADIVKAMVTIDDFGTNPLSHSQFQSYPPGMSLFQYFLQKLNMEVEQKYIFSEWRLYFAYQIYIISLLMPFFKGISLKKHLLMFISMGSIFFAPMGFFKDIYSSTYIDPVLGILSGTGLAMIFVWKEKDIFYSIHILLLCSMLVLTKDVGVVFAAFLAFAYATDNVLRKKYEEGNLSKRGKYKSVIKEYGIALLAVLLPKVLWSHEVSTSGAYSPFSDKLDMMQLWKVLIIDKESYQHQVIINYWDALWNRPFFLGNTSISLCYPLLLCVIIILLFFLYKLLNFPTSKAGVNA